MHTADTGTEKPASVPANDPRPLRWLIALSLVTLVLAVAVPFAPVDAEEPVVSWPRAGEQAVSTDLPLTPYRPLSFDATMPCTALRTDGDILRTLPATPVDHPQAAAAQGADQGLRVEGRGGRVMIDLSGRRILDQAVPAGPCGYRLRADEHGVVVTRDGTSLVSDDNLLPPQVAQLATDATDATGLTVTLRPDDRYASSPTTTKTVLVIAHLLALAATLVLAWRVFRSRGPGVARPRPGLADGVLVAVVLAWAVLGPMNFDDSWYALMASGAGESGYVGNQVYMFNVTENPFVVTQYLARFWGMIGDTSLLWLRLLPAIYGIATWVLLRTFLETALGRGARVRAVPWALLLAFLVWWLPYGGTLRPEPFIVLCAAGVLVLADLARRQESVAALIGALATTVLAVTASPSGIVAAAPLVLTLPWLCGWLRTADGWHRVAALLGAGAAGTVLVPIAFADASLGDVLDAAQVHSWYYSTFNWYEELQHYWNLLRVGETGSFGVRAPVLLTLLVSVLAAIGSGRGPRPGDPLRRLLLSSAVVSVTALLLLTPTPTKWVNHFGAAAAPSIVLIAVALLRTPIPRPRSPRHSGQLAVVAGVVAVAGVAAVIFAGPNIWRPWTDFGMPFGDRDRVDGPAKAIEGTAPSIGGVFLRNPLLWLLIVVAIALAIRWWRRRGRSTTMTVDRGVLVTACASVVAMMLFVFVAAPIRQAPGWSVAEANLRTVGGDSCGLAEGVAVALPAGNQPVRQPGPTRTTGAFAQSLDTTAPVHPPTGGTVWHDTGSGNATDGGPDTGDVTTPWWTLPAQRAPLLLVPVAAGWYDGQRVQVEISTGSNSPQPDQRIDLTLDDETEPNTWQQVQVELPAAAKAVRLVATDRARGPASWLAVSDPVLSDWSDVTDLTRGRAVYADKLSTALWPCVHQVGIRHGIHDTPQVLLSAADGIFPMVLNNATQYDWGGVFVNVDRTATYVEVPSRLDPAPGADIREWGRVRIRMPDHPVGQVDLTVTTDRRDGWERGPTLAREDYAGRDDTG